MSNPKGQEQPEEPFRHIKSAKNIPQLVPSQFATIHADKVMVAIDYQGDTATLTLMTMHVIPKVDSAGWGKDNVKWEMVGEVKIPIPALNALMFFYLAEISNGLNIVPLIEDYLKKHPVPHPQFRQSTYGPFNVEVEQKK